jgi:hypothetical protein
VFNWKNHRAILCRPYLGAAALLDGIITCCGIGRATPGGIQAVG